MGLGLQIYSILVMYHEDSHQDGTAQVNMYSASDNRLDR